MTDKTLTRIIIVSFILTGGLMWHWWETEEPAVATAEKVKPLPDLVSSTNFSFGDSSPVVSNIDIVGQDKTPVPETLHQRLQRMLLQPSALANETVLQLKDLDSYRAFLKRAEKAGLHVVSKIDQLLSVRVRFASMTALERELSSHPEDYVGVGANFAVEIPKQPEIDERAAAMQVPVKNNLLDVMGISSDDRRYWGQGVTIAVLDSGVSKDPTFGNRVSYIDIGMGITGNGSKDGHGTAVAALAAGAGNDAAGVAPAANILSIKVTNNDSVSDMFSISQGIYAAVDAGANIINASLGGYATNAQLKDAIAYARDHGVVIVASSGNDQYNQLAWPAASPDVVSVGAVDALGQLASFSNSGEGLDLTAPGYAINTAWLSGQRVTFSGTSASAPIVSGAIAAVMSTTPGTSAEDAVNLLESYANDSGAPGQDEEYGIGTVNLDWLLNRNDTTRIDVAVSSQYYDTQAGTMTIVVQNRSEVSVYGLDLTTWVGSEQYDANITTLAPHGISATTIPLKTSLSTQPIYIQSRVTLPGGLIDSNPANNEMKNIFALPGVNAGS